MRGKYEVVNGGVVVSVERSGKSSEIVEVCTKDVCGMRGVGRTEKKGIEW